MPRPMRAGPGGQTLSSLSKTLRHRMSSLRQAAAGRGERPDGVPLSDQGGRFQRWEWPSFSLTGRFDFPGHPENMPPLQPHQDALCEVHLKVSAAEWNPNPGACIRGFPGSPCQFCLPEPWLHTLFSSVCHAPAHVVFTQPHGRLFLSPLCR